MEWGGGNYAATHSKLYKYQSELKWRKLWYAYATVSKNIIGASKMQINFWLTIKMCNIGLFSIAPYQVIDPLTLR